MSTKLEPGRRYHCQELTTGRRRTGIFRCDPDDMAVKLYDYERSFHLEEGAPLHLRLEDNLVVSMLDTVAGRPGFSSYLHEPQATTHHFETSANIVVSGHRPWQLADPVRRVWFSVPHCEPLLRNRDRLKAVRGKILPAKAASDPLFEVEAAGLVVRCWYVLSGSLEFGTRSWQPLFEIEFEEPRTVETYLEPLHSLLQFLSAAAGFELTPSHIRVSPRTHAEALAGIDADRPSDESYSVHYVWAQAEVEPTDVHPRNSFVLAHDAADLLHLAQCLKAWLLRDAAWSKATALMVGSLRLVKQVSGRRLLIACWWLEAIPGGQAARSLDGATLAAVVGPAGAAARTQGGAELERRVVGLLKGLGRETHEMRFQRLVASVVAVFGEGAFGSWPDGGAVVRALAQAMRFRNREAHGFIEGDRDELVSLMASTAAIEALCYLLTIRDLPIDAAGRERALSSRVVRAWHYAETAGHQG